MRAKGDDIIGPQAAEADRGAASLELSSVSHRFGDLQTLAGVDLTVGAAETVAIVGPSGCGKTTLLELAAGLAEPTAGSVAVGGAADPPARLAGCAYMPQRDQLFPWLRAIDNAALGPRLAGHSRREAREAARPLLERLGLERFESAYPAELSGGMRQRVAFARTLLAGSGLLLLDEPFASLDAITRADLQEWLLEALALEPRAVLLVTHDVEEALFCADRVIVFSPRPGRPVLSESSPWSGPGGRPPRTAAVSSPAFTAARERALEALRSTP
jgi:ABC-type nitrate/sulfonate/bicarbonate transport system ATPase subunit